MDCSLASKADRGEVWSLRENADARFAALQSEVRRLRQDLGEARAEADGIRERAARAEGTCEELQRQICLQAECLAAKAEQHTLERVQEAWLGHVTETREAAQASAHSISQLRDKVRGRSPPQVD